MLKIRLRRVGKKKQPAYRMVVAESRSPRDGAFLDIIGHYNPLTDPATISIDEEKARSWLQKGAQPSETAVYLLARQGLMEAPPPKTRAPKPPKSEAKAAAPGAPVVTATAATATEEPPAAAAVAVAEGDSLGREPTAESIETAATADETPAAEAVAEATETTEEPAGEPTTEESE